MVSLVSLSPSLKVYTQVKSSLSPAGNVVMLTESIIATELATVKVDVFNEVMLVLSLIVTWNTHSSFLLILPEEIISKLAKDVTSVVLLNHLVVLVNVSESKSASDHKLDNEPLVLFNESPDVMFTLFIIGTLLIWIVPVALKNVELKVKSDAIHLKVMFDCPAILVVSHVKLEILV